MKNAFLLLTSLVLGTAVGVLPATADSGPLRDPTGCATGSAVANCRSVPPIRNGYSDRDSNTRGSDRLERKSPSLMRTSPLPSEYLRRPPSSTGLDKGSTGLTPERGSGSRLGH